MKIAYLTDYLGRKFINKYLKDRKYAVSGTLKSQGIARALLKANHEVIIFSTGSTLSNSKIKSFSEIEEFPEGKLIIQYSTILSYRKFSIINDIIQHNFIKEELKKYSFDVLLFYNITLRAALNIGLFKNQITILEYEDNIFNKSLVGNKNNFEWIKKILFNFIIDQTDAVIAVCNGLLLENKIKYQVLIPGIINEDVTQTVTKRVNSINKHDPINIILIGGTHYSKGVDLLIKSLHFTKYKCHVKFYGPGLLNPEIESEIEKLPSYHKVTFEGFFQHKDLIKILDKDADILINTTRSMGVGAQSAGFPFKMMEYAATGRPIISSEIGKLDEDFNKHITYYEDENPKNIACAIDTVIENYDSKVQLALKLQDIVLQEYTIEGTSKKIDLLLQEIK